MSLLTTLAQHVARRPQRIALLQQIAEQGSITRAAKAAGLSYKAAWDAIEELNNLAATPLVERSVGGRGGGGARLSAQGQRLLQLYQRLEALQAQVLQAAEHDSDLQLLGRLMLHTSARNQLSGQVRAIHPGGGNDLIEIELPGGASLQAQITRDSTERLLLQPGSHVVALFKAGWLSLNPATEAPPKAESATPDNLLSGHIEQLMHSGDDCEVHIRLKGGQSLCALIPTAELEAKQLTLNSPVQARVSPSQVLIGRQF